MAIGTITSNACRCYHSTFTEEVAQSDPIFIRTVLKKTSANQVYYLFSISQMFKGDKADTLTIRTGFGGPDCGMNFKVGETYIVYSDNKQTSRCRRNSPVDNNIDLDKLKYLFQNGFSSDIGASANPVLTDNESEFFNSELCYNARTLTFIKGK